MATKASLLSLLPFILLATQLASASIEEVCRKAAAGGRVNRGSCNKILRAAPGASAADDRGLAVIAGNLGAAHARATLPTINKLLRSAGPATKGPLQDCKELYGNAVDDLKSAAASARSNRFADANIRFSAAMDASATCEDGFSEKNVKSPLTAADSKLLLLATVGAAITHSGP
ncbi:hypothetical protein Taro_038990 [Colocasia esculenta]|uniref:Pectinesterase inhibitor domain-containing protein n=1 Tax=Colocasia esculenta TaxID=4460 RepID=A0A843WKU3_COLES|nr:hypothetical protein [Colocasia esculenta]